jgi:hypothetical protein
LCTDEWQFPIHPSSLLLQYQTDFMHFVGYQVPASHLVLATRAIATGYTLGSDPSAKASFAQAVGYLQVYVNDIESILGQGHLKPETAALLVSQANTLIQQVGALAD